MGAIRNANHSIARIHPEWAAGTTATAECSCGDLIFLDDLPSWSAALARHAGFESDDE